MKKTVRIISVLLALVLALSSFVFAVGEEENPTCTLKDADSTVTFSDDYKSMSVTFKDPAIVKNGLYVVMMLMLNENDLYIPTDSTTLYINLVVAAEDGSVTFPTVYPSKFKSGKIMVSGTDLNAVVDVAEITYPKSWDVLYGDVNGDGYVETLDATWILRYAAFLTDLTEEQMDAADVNADGYVETLDATWILRYAAFFVDLEDFPANQ